MHLFLSLVLGSVAGFHQTLAKAETHAELQSVTDEGLSAWGGSHPFTLHGVLLNNPEDMLDWTPQFIDWDGGAGQLRMGGEWQVIVQAADPSDRGGTTCWMGQNYGNLPWLRDSELSYSNAAWVAEVNRLNYDPNSFHRFRAGDWVEITARGSLSYGGKRNVNETHDIDPSRNFDMRLVEAGRGLPNPEVITLADVVRPDDGNPATQEDLFDASRASGGEHWQGMRARINGLTLVAAEGWNSTNAWNVRKCLVTDGAGRYLTLRVPRYDLGSAPTNRFDAIGIFTQESGSSADGTFGYELFAQEVIPEVVPALNIAKQIRVTWPSVGGVYQLEVSDHAEAGPWTVINTSPVLMDGREAVFLDLPHSKKFYRLKRVD